MNLKKSLVTSLLALLFADIACAKTYDELQNSAQNLLDRFSMSIKNLETTKRRVDDLGKDVELFSGDDRNNIIKLKDAESKRLAASMGEVDELIEASAVVEKDMEAFAASDSNLSHVNRIKGVREDLVAERARLELIKGNLNSYVPPVMEATLSVENTTEKPIALSQDIEKPALNSNNEIAKEIMAEKMEVVSEAEQTTPVAENIKPAAFSDTPFLPEAGGAWQKQDEASQPQDLKISSIEAKSIENKEPVELVSSTKAEGVTASQDLKVEKIDPPANVSAEINEKKPAEAEIKAEAIIEEHPKVESAPVEEPQQIAEEAPRVLEQEESLVASVTSSAPDGDTMAYVSLDKDINSYKWYFINAAQRGLYENPNAKFKIVEISENPTGQAAAMVQQILVDSGISNYDIEVVLANQPGVSEVRLVKVSSI